MRDAGLEYLTYIAEVLREARPMLVLVGTVSCANCFHGCLLEGLRAEDLASESLLQERMTLKELVDLHSDPPLDGLPQMHPCMSQFQVSEESLPTEGTLLEEHCLSLDSSWEVVHPTEML